MLNMLMRSAPSTPVHSLPSSRRSDSKGQGQFQLPMCYRPLRWLRCRWLRCRWLRYHRRLAWVWALLSLWLTLMLSSLQALPSLAAQPQPNLPQSTLQFSEVMQPHLELSKEELPRIELSQTDITGTDTALEQGRLSYQRGEFQAAVDRWQEAVQQYEAQGDRANQTLALSYLSLAYQALNQWELAQQAIDRSLNQLQVLQTRVEPILWAQVLNTQAGLYFHLGKAEMALETWQRAQGFYQQAGDQWGSLGSQINQAKALQSLGFYRRSRQQLEDLAAPLEALPDSELKVSGLHSLGLALQAIGDLETSVNLLKTSLAIAQRLGAQPYVSTLYLDLGQLASNLGERTIAQQYLAEAATLATDPGNQLQIHLEQLKLAVANGKQQEAARLSQQMLQQLKSLPPSRTSLYAAIHLAAQWNRWDHPTGRQAVASEAIISVPQLRQLLKQTVQSAQDIQDLQAEAYALYQWGQLEQQRGQWPEAKRLAQQSLAIARRLNAEDIIAQAAWRLGQSYRAMGQRSQAIIAYQEAVKALQTIRTDLVAINPDIQFSFQESVEPVYRELVALLLDDPNPLDRQPSQANLIQARELIESLQVAELDNFFREACVDQTQQIDQVDPAATVIYPIILPDRLAVIFSRTGQPLRYYQTLRSQEQIEAVLKQFLAGLNPVSNHRIRDRAAQQLYDWLIRPAETEQVLQGSKTLVFVLDGLLRNIPMAALYNGQQYLIEKYAVALSPAMQLLAAHDLQLHQNRAIVGGISQQRAGFIALPAVESEVQEVANTVPSTTLLNQEFTNEALGRLVENTNANVVHLATHGQFSSRQEDTFLLTWDGQMSIQELASLLRHRGADASQAIELLVLSACDTAAGDNRAVLGLAGLAIKSGARSTLATLWPVRDQAAASLMTDFYRQLQQPAQTKAEALRQAQLHLIHQKAYKDPFFWSPFVLVGNWL